jgi:membrane protein DedA with SNARE-associated domain
MSAGAFIQHYGYLAVFIGVFFEGETVLIAASFAAHEGYLDVPWVILTAFLGAIAGDEFYFFLGRFKGRVFLAKHPSWQVRVGKVQRLLERYHRLIILGFRFLYGLRTVTPFALGMMSDIKVSQFVALNLVGAFVWSVVMGLFGFLFGVVLDAMITNIRRVEHHIMLAIILVWVLGWTWYFIRKKRLKKV